MATIGGVHHLAIKAADVERVARFYREVLGLAEERRHQDDAGTLRSIWFRAGSAILMIERSTQSGAPIKARDFSADPPGIHVLALSIDPADGPALASALAIVHRTDYTLYVLDPEGNRVGLSSYPERLVVSRAERAASPGEQSPERGLAPSVPGSGPEHP